LELAQTRYAAFDWELMACFSGIRHCRHMLEGRKFILFTDHVDTILVQNIRPVALTETFLYLELCSTCLK
jgi:hypothetical protein